MEKNYEEQIFPEEGNILGTVKFKFPGEGEYSLAFNGRSSVKIQDIVNKVCLGKRIKNKIRLLTVCLQMAALPIFFYHVDNHDAHHEK